MNVEGFIWGICDDVLRGLYKPNKYGEVILPFLVLRRLDCVHEEHKDKVVELYNELKDRFDDPSDIIHTKLGINFSNHSRYDLRRLVNEPSKLNENLYEYIRSFSPNVQDIIKNFGLQEHIDNLEENDKLYRLVEKFSEVDLHPTKVDNHLMGTIYEELLRKFSELSNETSGDHFTPRDIVSLIISCVFSTEKEKLIKPNKIISLYDPCCGTGGMLTIGKRWINENISKDIEVNMFGQELNPQTYSICKSDFLITNEQPENIKKGSTLSRDGFNDGRKFDYMICNPPYGVNWKTDKKFVENESSDPSGRFCVGTPSVSDGQLLFLQHMISKMEPSGSRIGVLFNGSTSFTGDSGSGESEIRKWIIENDMLETVIQLPDKMFFNTPITTYIWIVTNKKNSLRKGKVQLIDGSKFFKPLRKKQNEKGNEITEDHIEKIIKTYKEFTENQICKIYENSHFGYTKITIETPRKENGVIQKKKSGELIPDKHCRKYERVPLSQSIEDHFINEIKPFSKDSWINESLNKVGYEINFIKYFYKPYKFSPLDIVSEKFKKLENNSESLPGELISKKYNDYTVVDSHWFGEIPSHWEKTKNKYLLFKTKSKVGEQWTDYTLLTMGNDGVNIRDMDGGGKFPKEFNDYQIVEPNQLIFCLYDIDETPRTVGLSSQHGMITSSYDVMTVTNENDPRYWDYFYRMIDNHKGLRPFYTGLRNVVRNDTFEVITIYRPPLQEQEKISNFIETEYKKIDELIKKQELKIKTLKEYKKSLLFEVITGKRNVSD